MSVDTPPAVGFRNRRICQWPESSTAPSPDRQFGTVKLKRSPRTSRCVSYSAFLQLHGPGGDGVDIRLVHGAVAVHVGAGRRALLNAACQGERVQNIHLTAAVDVRLF